MFRNNTSGAVGVFPLTMAGNDKRVKINSIPGGRCLRQRLCDMGLYAGVTVELIRNDISGPVILGVLGSRVVIGRGQAHKIMVEVAD